MTTYKHILLTADLIEKDDHPVVAKAMELVKLSGAKLSIIHVVEYQYYYGMPYETTIYADMQSEIENAASNSFNKLADKLNIPTHDRYMPSGRAQQQILEISEKLGIDLIVIGSHGRHGLTGLLMGSTATGVINNAKCDVLTVRIK